MAIAELEFKAAVDALRDMVRGARRAVAFTGAGISTECGIPDFRSPGGIWTRYQPIGFGEFLSSREKRLEAWRRKFAVDDSCAGAEPGRTHRAIARLMEEGHIAAVITQNIDGLHAASGIAADRLIELHGNGTYATCLSCNCRFELGWVRARIEESGEAPDCQWCGGPVKSATISFGQPMPEAAMLRAQDLAEEADLFLALGSSLVVYPAAALPVIAKRAGARLAIVNRDPTEIDGLADLVLHADLGEVFQAILRNN